MKNVVIVDSVRTGLAKSHRGGFNMTRPDNMLAHIINALLLYLEMYLFIMKLMELVFYQLL